MWHTQCGDRVLLGAEARLFRDGLDSLWYWLDFGSDDDAPFVTQVDVFDRLTLPAKLAMLERVGAALLREKVACPELTAVTEGAIAAVFYHVEGEVVDEIRYGRAMRWRRRIRAACVQRGLTAELPDVTSRDEELWRMSVEALSEQILWDCDWDTGDLLVDLHPAAARHVRDFAGILDDYYTAIAPDPTAKELRRIRSSLQRLTSEGRTLRK